MSEDNVNNKFTYDVLQPYVEDSTDMVNHPSHYTNGSVEVIEIIEDAIQKADRPKNAMLQGQVLKYMLRMWLKQKPLEDAKKAQWYLNRLIKSLNE